MIGLVQLVEMTDEKLARIDPLLMNLAVAQGIPTLVGLEADCYVRLADRWAEEIRRFTKDTETEFWKSPQDWKNDLDFFRLGILCWYIDEVLGVRYHEDQKYDGPIGGYKDPSHLFLNGVMDTRKGTCANMAALHVALAWRLDWPVYLACIGWHVLARFEGNGDTHNIETTNNGKGGFHSHSDSYYAQEYGGARYAFRGGSLEVGNLLTMKGRAMLGLFVGMRARHYFDTGSVYEAGCHYQLASHLSPTHKLFADRIAVRHLLSPSWDYLNRPWISCDIDSADIARLCRSSIGARQSFW
jgi:hypothetical protein